MARTKSKHPELNYKELIKIRVAPFQREKLIELAEDSGKSLSHYIRGVLLPVLVSSERRKSCPTCGQDLPKI